MSTARSELKETQSSHQEEFSLLVKTIAEKIKQLSVDLPDAENWEVEEFDKTPIGRALVTKEDVLKVVHRLKSCIGNSALSPKTERIHVGAHHPELLTIKINHFVVGPPSYPLPNFIFTLINKNGEREYYFVRNKELRESISKLSDLASKMNLAEFSLLKCMAKKQGGYPLSAWDSEWEDPETHGLYYDKVNDPLILEEYTKRALPLSSECKEGQCFTVLDIGAGKGRLAHKIISETLSKSVPIHYILVEPSKDQLSTARERLAEFSKNTNCKITYVNSTLEALDLNERAHCIVSTGGPLNADVVTREQAIANVKRMQALLLPNGILIATGQTALLVKGKHFEQEKLRVLSYAIPCPTPKGLEENGAPSKCANSSQ